MRKRFLSVVLFSALVAASTSAYATTSLVVSGGGMSTYSVSAVIQESLTDPLVMDVISQGGFSNVLYDDVGAFNFTQSVPLSVPQFNPTLGTLVSARVHGSALGDVTWRYQWAPASGWDFWNSWGIFGGRVDGQIAVSIPGYSWSVYNSGNIPKNDAWHIERDSNGEEYLVPDVPTVTGTVNIIGSDTDHELSNLSAYIGYGYVSNATVNVMASMWLDVDTMYWIAGVPTAFGVANISGIMEGDVHITYDYINSDGAAAQLTVPVIFGSIAAVPEPATLGVLGLATGALALRRKR